MLRLLLRSTLFPYTTLFRSGLIIATALIAGIGNAQAFRNGRQLSAWLGLVPRQNSSGGKEALLGISKRGNVYLRALLIDRKSTRLNSSHRCISYAVFCLKKK